MGLQIGTKVKFLNDIGGGKITAFRDGNIAVVETDDGFEVPVLVTELVTDEGNLFDEEVRNQKNVVPPEEKRSPKDGKREISFEEKKYIPYKGEVFLAIVPENEQLLHVSNFSLYLVNNSNYYFSYVISKKESGPNELIRIASVRPGKTSEVEVFSQTQMTKIKALSLQGSFYKHGLFEHVPQIDLSFDLENISFYKLVNFGENEYFSSKALILKKEEIDMDKLVEGLSDTEIARVTRFKEGKDTRPKTKSVNKEIEEIDLHIEEILEDHAGMSNGEILETQLGRFETSLETAIRSGVKKVVFIHGVGNGKLKHELCKKLDRKYPDLKYQDASFKEYGYGATMVYLR